MPRELYKQTTYDTNGKRVEYGLEPGTLQPDLGSLANYMVTEFPSPILRNLYGDEQNAIVLHERLEGGIDAIVREGLSKKELHDLALKISIKSR